MAEEKRFNLPRNVLSVHPLVQSYFWREDHRIEVIAWFQQETGEMWESSLNDREISDRWTSDRFIEDLYAKIAKRTEEETHVDNYRFVWNFHHLEGDLSEHTATILVSKMSQVTQIFVEAQKTERVSTTSDNLTDSTASWCFWMAYHTASSEKHGFSTWLTIMPTFHRETFAGRVVENRKLPLPRWLLRWT